MELSMVDIVEEIKDPVADKVRAMVEADMTQVSQHESWESLQSEILSCTLMGKTIILVDCPTSKTKIVLERVAQAAALVPAGVDSKFVIVVTVGLRLDVLAAVAQKAKTILSIATHFVVTLTGANKNQGARSKTTFVVVVQSKTLKDEWVPFQIEAMGGKAHGYEKLRLRCMNRNCSLRDRAPVDADGLVKTNPTDAQEELNKEDLQYDGLDDMLDAIETTEEGSGDANDEQVPEASRYVVDLFPFSQSLAFYLALMKSTCHVQTARNFILLTSTSHPNAWIAARGLSLRCFVWSAGPGSHAKKHGNDLANHILGQRHWATASATVTASVVSINKRQLDALQYIVVTAPEAQVVQLFDVAPRSTWRSGLNLHDRDLEKLMPELLAEELSTYDLEIGLMPKGRTLVAKRGIREGQCICDAKVLLFESKPGLQAFLQSDSSRAYLCDRIVEIRNVQKGPEAMPLTLWGLLVGCAGYLQHYQGIRRQGPNATLEVHCGEGPNDGVLKVICSTRNGAGIAPKAEIVINYGPDYDLTVAAPQPESKKFKGALDAFFSRKAVAQAQEGNDLGADGDEPKPPVGAAATGAGGPGPGKSASETAGPAPAAASGGSAPAAAASGGSAPAAAASGGSAPAAASGSGGSAPTGSAIPAPMAKHVQLALAESQTADAVILCKDLLNVFGAYYLSASSVLKVFSSDTSTNKKLPPRTILASFNQGKIGEGTEVPFTFGDTGKTLVACRKRQALEIVTLKECIASTKAERAIGHGKFPAGKPPVHLVVQKTISFFATDSKVQSLLKALPKCDALTRVWILKHDEKENSLLPWGLAVMVKKQLIVPKDNVIEISM